MFGMASVPVCAPAIVGANFSTMVQFAAGRTVFPEHRSVDNPGPVTLDAIVPLDVIVPMVRLAVPVFVQVNVCVTLLPKLTLPNARDDGEQLIPDTGTAKPVPEREILFVPTLVLSLTVKSAGPPGGCTPTAVGVKIAKIEQVMPVARVFPEQVSVGSPGPVN